MWRALVCTIFATLDSVVLASDLKSQVVQLQAVGTSYYEGYGVTANFWGTRYDGWIGGGFQDGMRAGGFVRYRFRRDTLRLGNDLLALTYPTDVFRLPYSALFQGATLQTTRGTWRLQLLAGASAIGSGSPGFASQNAGRPFAALLVSDSLSPHLRLFGTLLGARRQTASGGIEWRDSSRTILAMTTGVGSNAPFIATSGTVVRDAWEVRGSFSHAAPGYRRADLPVPVQPRVDGLALEAVLHLREWLSVTANRLTFVRDSALLVNLDRGTGTSFNASARSTRSIATLGIYHSQSATARDVTAYLALGRTFSEHFAADVYQLVHRPRGHPLRLTHVINLNERVTRTLSLDQMITIGAGQRGLSLGGSYLGAVADASIGYQLVHAPFDAAGPFLRTLNVSLRMNIGEYTAHLGTTLLSTGHARYDGSLSRFLYFNGVERMQSSTVPVRMSRYIVRGRVTDEAGAPIVGAAVEVGTALVFTDSRGQFYLRLATRRPQPITVRLGDFLHRGTYRVVSAPVTVTPDVDAAAAPVVIVLARQD
jgi:hypothetical protein